MRKHLLICALVGIGAQSAFSQNFSLDRLNRTFREQPTATKVNGTILADIVVAYEDGPGAMSSAEIKKLMEDASEALFVASKGAVQLGKVTIMPTTLKSDPDLLILKDAASGCPTGLKRTGDGTSEKPVCADASTGGYIGSAWWEAPSLVGGKPVFSKTYTIPNTNPAQTATVEKVGARITTTWGTLKNYGANALVHEFGHYLFGMRDEYEANSFSLGSPDAPETYMTALAKNPFLVTPSGVSLSKASVPYSGSTALITGFHGFGMSFLSKYSPTLGYSPADIDVAGTLHADMQDADPNGTDDLWWVLEQFSTLGARGANSVSSRKNMHGGMWSLETSIRTALNKAYTPEVLPAADYSKTRQFTEVNVYTQGQSNVFVMDRSGTMSSVVTGSTTATTRWDVAVDLLGYLSHPEVSDAKVKYPSSAKFGFISFDTQRQPLVTFPANIGAVSALTTTYVPEAGTPSKNLRWMSAKDASNVNVIPGPGSRTDLLSALNMARDWLNTSTSFQRNVVLVSDGLHNEPNEADFKGNEGFLGNYRVFTITVDTKQTDKFGMLMQSLATTSHGPEGEPGQAYFTGGNSTTAQLAAYTELISSKINQMDDQTFDPSVLFRDNAKEYPKSVNAGVTNVQFMSAYTGSVAPTVALRLPNGQLLIETGLPAGITFRSQPGLKIYDVDLNVYQGGIGDWAMRVSSSANTPINIVPAILVKNQSRGCRLSFDPSNANATGSLPVTVTVQDGRPIEGLNVVATLTSRGTGITKSIPLTWTGAAYVGTFKGGLQPGIANLTATISYPTSGAAYLASGENYLPNSQRVAYPFFKPEVYSAQVWIDGAASTKATPGLEAWTLQEEPNFAQGTRLKLFLKNGTSVPWTGLKARYFFSVSELANGVPAWSDIYRPTQTPVKVGTVPTRPGLAYVEFDFVGKTLAPGASSSNGTNGGENIFVIAQNWRTPWDPANDWSAQGLKTTWSVNPFVNIYGADGKLLVGNPDLDQVVVGANSAPVAAVTSPVVAAAGVASQWTANAIDPDGDAMTYQWKVNGSVVASGSKTLSYVFPASGTYTVDFIAIDSKNAATQVSSKIYVQAASGSCNASNSVVLGYESAAGNYPLVTGSNCFVVKVSKKVRDWNWTMVKFQLNSDNGVPFSGVTVQSLATGATTSVSGYSQEVTLPDPGVGKDLYLKVNSPTTRPARIVWWGI